MHLMGSVFLFINRLNTDREIRADSTRPYGTAPNSLHGFVNVYDYNTMVDGFLVTAGRQRRQRLRKVHWRF